MGPPEDLIVSGSPLVRSGDIVFQDWPPSVVICKKLDPAKSLFSSCILNLTGKFQLNRYFITSAPEPAGLSGQIFTERV